MKPAEPDALRSAANLLEAYTALGTPEELWSLRERAEKLRMEVDALRVELAEKGTTIAELNRRIDWMQRYTLERQQ